MMHKAEVEELTAKSFRERVLSMNKTGGHHVPIIVFFHVSWCEHCKAATPEYRKAAAKIQEAHKLGIKAGPAPKFYSLQCDNRAEDQLCGEYSGNEYPEIGLFRDRRQFRFGNRMRYAEVIAWWVKRHTRSPLREATSLEAFENVSRNETAFLLHVSEENGQDRELVEAWRNIAFDYLDAYSFFYTNSSSEIAKSMQLPQGIVSVHVKGPKALELSPRPVVRPVTPAGLKAWVNYNQFPIITPLHWGSYDVLMRSGHTVIALMHGGNYSGALYKQQFERKAVEFRAKIMDVSKKEAYLFSSINMSDAGALEFMKYQFPVLGHQDIPRIFAFSGAGGRERYWEDPTFNDTRNFTSSDIRWLLEDEEALQENSVLGWIKGKRKLLIRYASQSNETFALAAGIPSAVVLIVLIIVWVLCKALILDDEDASAAPVDEDKLSMAAQAARELDHDKVE